MARWAIETFTERGAWLLDPFAGSGTALVEARLLGRNMLAADIDPLSRLLCRVKATPLPPERVEQAIAQVERGWDAHRNQVAQGTGMPARLPEFPNRDHWFHTDVQRDLAALRDVVAQVKDRGVRDLLLVAYSSMIITKGPSTVANALDIAHSRAHHVERPQPPDVWARFRERCRRILRAVCELYEQACADVQTLVLGQDARALPFRARVADAIITSPPYATAIEYPRGHKFSVWWIGELIGVPNRVYDQLRSAYIGTENVHRAERAALRAQPLDQPSVRRVTAALDECDELRAGRARRYFHDMRLALAEMLRALKPRAFAVLVVADSHLRNVAVPTGQCLTEIAESLTVDGDRFVHRDTISRVIRERSRQLPIKRGSNAGGMKTEEVIILQRSSASASVRAMPL